jgi:hypothetical protein
MNSIFVEMCEMGSVAGVPITHEERTVQSIGTRHEGIHTDFHFLICNHVLTRS